MVPSNDPPVDLIGKSTTLEAPDQTLVVPVDEETSQPPSHASAELAAVQAERRRIAQALHDTVSQTLTGTCLLARVAARKLEASHPEAAGEVTRLAEMIQQAVIELQEVHRSLQPESAFRKCG